MTNTKMVAQELHNAGFRTELDYTDTHIIVSLTSRKVSKSEVETALDQIFCEIEFSLVSIGQAVMVTL